MEVAFHSVSLTLWWEACGFAKVPPHPDHSGKGYRPRVPEAVLYTNDRACYAAFLRGLFEADGTVIQGCPSWTTATAALFQQVKTLLLTLGYPTSTKHDVSVWCQSTLYVLRPVRTRREAEALARRDNARVFAVRPSWSMPAPEWVVADPAFWRGAPSPRTRR